MGASFTYDVYGLTLRVPFFCADLPVGDATRPHDIVVVEAEVPENLIAPEIKDAHVEAQAGRILFRFGRLSGNFLVENGCRITVQRRQTADETVLGFHLTQVMLALAMLQRGYLVLHASTVARDGDVVVLAGPSGAGKSTTLAALVGQGWKMLSDDITVLRQSPSGEIDVLPGVPRFSLFEHTAQGLNLDITGLPLHEWRRKKAFISVPAAGVSRPCPLTRVVILETGCGRVVEREVVEGVQGFSLLHDSLYGPVVPSEYRRLLPVLAAVTNRVKMTRIRRPRDLWSVDEVVAAIADEPDHAA